MKPLVIDTFPIHDELDMLECRLVELYNHVDFFVAVEADVTHQDNPKPWYLTNNLDRFTEWKDKLVVVHATGLPTIEEDSDPWARELGQRAFVDDGLKAIGVRPHDIILHGDLDEIPRGLYARNVRPKPGWFVSFQQRLHCFAVDWLHPDPWYGTVAGTYETVLGIGDHVNPFARMRDRRNRFGQAGYKVDGQALQDAGWHLSWMGGRERSLHKLGAFCHPEVADIIGVGLEEDLFYKEGVHVDGRKQAAVDVDETWPKWVREGHAPTSWFRPR